MNGLNKKRKSYTWKKTFYLLSAIYVFVVLSLVVITYQIPNIYQMMDQQRITAIKSEIKEALTTNSAQNTKELSQLIQDNNIELAVVSENGYEFSSLGSTEFSKLNNEIKDHALSYRSSYNLSVGDLDYQVWLAVYQMEPQRFFERVIVLFTIVVLLLFCILTVMIFAMFRKLIHPISRLKNNILKLKNYQFTHSPNEFLVAQSEYDVLSEELSEFTEDLQGKMNHFGLQYTALEKELQSKQERLIYKDQLVGSMVHDLKTPLSMSYLKLEKALKKVAGNPELENEILDLMTDNEEMLKEIQETVKVVYQKEMLENISKIDVVKVLVECIKRFDTAFKKKQILYDLEIPRSLILEIDLIELKQILHNVIVNIAQYTPEKGHFEISLYEEEGFMKIDAYNEATAVEKIEFEHVFDLFYRNSVNQNEGYGNGVGMFTIQNMVSKYQGDCQFEPYENGVRLRLSIPMVRAHE